jgi:hypothetical protein
MTTIMTDAMIAQTQSDEGKNKEIIHENFAKWANGTGNFFDLGSPVVLPFPSMLFFGGRA